MKLVYDINPASSLVVVGDGMTDWDSKIPYESNLGDLLRTALQLSSVNPTIIEMRKRPGEDAYDANVNETLDEYGRNIYQLLDELKPERVLFLGRTAASLVCPELTKKKTQDQLMKFPFTGTQSLKCQVAVTSNPFYVMRESKEDSSALSSWVDHIINLVTGLTSEKIKVQHIPMDLQGYVQFLSDVDKEIDAGNIEEIGLDVETNAMPQFCEDFVMTGFSTAINLEDNLYLAAWVEPWGSDDQESMTAIRNFFRKHQKRVITYNTTMETSVFWRWLGEFFEFGDALVTVTMDGQRTNLKDACRRELGVDLWEGEVHEWLDRWAGYFNTLTKDCKKAQHYLDEIRNGFDYHAHKARQQAYEEQVAQATTAKARNAIPMDFCGTAITIVESLLDELELEEIIFLMSFYPNKWGAVPRGILGEYCSKDAAYVIPLERKLRDKYKDGKEVYLTHPYLATVFEANGIPWDDKAAKEEWDYCTAKQTECLSALIPMLHMPPDEKLKAVTKIHQPIPYTNHWSTPSGQPRSAVVDTVEKKLDDLIGIFNPGANTQHSRDMFWKAYMTPEIEMATLLYCVITQLRNAGVWDAVLIAISEDFKMVVPEGADPEEMDYETEFLKSFKHDEVLSRIIVAGDDDKYTKTFGLKIAQAVTHATSGGAKLNYMAEYSGRLAKEVLAAQYDIQVKLLGKNVRDPSTWSPEFKMLLDITFFKRCAKIKSTYINGATGRDNVWVARKPASCVDIPIRLRPYSWEENNGGTGLAEDEFLLLQTSFNPLSAITSRWTSAVHTIPGDASVRRCLVPPEDDMLHAHIDYSQAELVMVATFANDEEMQSIFRNKGDMHRYVASVALQKPEKQVTKYERGTVGKGCNFGLVYGMGMESLAVSMCDGDVARAQQLMDTVLGRFPGLAKWLTENKEQGHTTGYAYGYFGNRIPLDGNINSTAVNYPIQCTSSMAAGLGMWLLDQDAKAKGVPLRSLAMVHDSDDIQFKINDLFTVMNLTRENMADSLYEMFSMPMMVDFECGVDAYHLCELKDVKAIEGGYEFDLVGDDKSVDLLLTKFAEKSKWDIVDIVELDREVIHVPLEEVFNQKSGLKSDKEWGSDYEELKLHVVLKEPIVH